jgi:ubiquinone/menaquinone biosynthesis C-methylase UbiE
MSEITNTELGRQLMKPSGEIGLQVAENMNVTNAKLYAFVLSHMQIKDNDKILEIGFGNGKTIPQFFAINPTIKFYGVDFSEIMCAKAISLNKEFEKSIHISCQNAMNMSFDNEFFDRIVTLNTIYFWENIERQLAEMKRVLRKNGQLIIGYRPKTSMQKLPFTQEVFTHYDSAELQAIITQNGFRIVNEECNETLVKSVEKGMIEMFDICLIAEKL